MKNPELAEACDVLKQAGLAGVVSVLASGNLIFQSDRPQSELSGLLERALSEHYNYMVFSIGGAVKALLLILVFQKYSVARI